MKTTFSLVQDLLAAMNARERSLKNQKNRLQEDLCAWAGSKMAAKAHVCHPQERVLLERLVDAMEMQDNRQTGLFHILPEVAEEIWGSAKLAGEAYVIEESARRFGYPGLRAGMEEQLSDSAIENPEAEAEPLLNTRTEPAWERPRLLGDTQLGHRDIDGVCQADPALSTIPGADSLTSRILGELPEAVGHLKKRAESMTRGLRQFGLQLKHGQALRVVAGMEGHTSFASLRQKLDRHAPNFCPHCGAAGTLVKVDTVFCEQGEYDGRSYEAEGEGAQYACSRCKGQFNDWSGL
jgi:hypothetical protein